MQKFAKTLGATRPAPERPVQIWTYILSFLPFLDHLRAIAVSKVLQLAGASQQSWPPEVHFQDKEMDYEMLNTLCELPKLRGLSIKLTVYNNMRVPECVHDSLKKLTKLESLSIVEANCVLKRHRKVLCDGLFEMPFDDWKSLTTLELKVPVDMGKQLCQFPPKVQQLTLETDHNCFLRSPFKSLANGELRSLHVIVRSDRFRCTMIPVTADAITQLRITGNGAEIDLTTINTGYTPNLQRLFLVCEDQEVQNLQLTTRQLMEKQLRVLQAPSLYPGKY